MSTTLSTESSYVKPHFNEEAGFEGLWDYEVAKSIESDKHKVREKLFRNLEYLEKTTLHPYGLKLFETTYRENKVGRPHKACFIPTRVAKWLAGTWNNLIGMGYYNFLLDCEKIVTEVMPMVLEQLKQVETERDQFRARVLELEHGPDVKALPKPKMGYVPVWGKNLWGEDEIVSYKMVEKDKANKLDLARGSINHKRKVVDGLNKKIDEDQKVLDFGTHKAKKALDELKLFEDNTPDDEDLD